MATNQFSPTLFTKTSNGRYTFISPESATMFGLTMKDFIGQSDLDIFGPIIGFDSQEIEQRVLATGASQTNIINFTQENTTIRLQITRHVYQADENHDPGIIGLIERIEPVLETTLEKAAEHSQPAVPDETAPATSKALNARFLDLSTAVAAITTSLNPDHILESLTWELTNMLQVDGCVVYKWNEPEANDTLLLLAAYSEESLEMAFKETISLTKYPFLKRLMIERTPKQLQHQRPNSQKNETAFLQMQSVCSLLILPLVFREQIYGLVELISLQPDHVFLDQDISVSQLLADQAAGAMANAWLYEALNEANKSLTASNAELDAFAHTVAHDLKSPLGAIIGFADLVSKEYASLPEKEIDEFLGYIVTNGHKMRAIIDGLLTLASVRREQVQFTNLNMQALVAEVKARLYYTIRENAAELVIATELPDSRGYMPWVEEVWANYISNAIKYGGQPPRITIGATKQDDGMVRYWVKDNGRGLSDSDQEKLFTPFTRLGHSDASGHGLGLSIVQRIINRLNGQVGVISEIGKGSEFFFTLPADNSNVL